MLLHSECDFFFFWMGSDGFIVLFVTPFFLWFSLGMKINLWYNNDTRRSLRNTVWSPMSSHGNWKPFLFFLRTSSQKLFLGVFLCSPNDSTYQFRVRQKMCDDIRKNVKTSNVHHNPLWLVSGVPNCQSVGYLVLSPALYLKKNFKRYFFMYIFSVAEHILYVQKLYVLTHAGMFVFYIYI